MPKTCPKCGSDMEPDSCIFAYRKGRVFYKRLILIGHVCVSCGYVEFWQERK